MYSFWAAAMLRDDISFHRDQGSLWVFKEIWSDSLTANMHRPNMYDKVYINPQGVFHETVTHALKCHNWKMFSVICSIFKQLAHTQVIH